MATNANRMSVEIRVGESLRLEGAGLSVVTLEHKSGQRARLRIEANEDIRIEPPNKHDNSTIAGYLAKQNDM